MARTLSSNIQTQIQSEGIRIAHLLKLEDLGASNTDLLVTNHVKNLSYNSETYEAGGNFLDIQPVEETGELATQSVNISLNNVTTTLRDLFKEEGYINNTATIFLVFLDTDETIIDTYEYFKGTITGANIMESKGTFKIDVELASQWKNWEIKKGRKFTQASQQSYIEKKIDDGDLVSGFTDVGLEFAHETNKDVRWNR
jgi:acyl-CoA-binding protein